VINTANWQKESIECGLTNGKFVHKYDLDYFLRKMMNSSAIETKNKVSKIYLVMGLAFVGLFSTITILSLFVSSLNF
jgi:hypothetical protein